jgi:hypothetical protein
MTTEPTWPQLEGLAVIRIRLGFSATSVIIEVWDRDSELPLQQQAAEYAEAGRGLVIVSALCSRWSARQISSGGKVVWGELPAPQELPRRQPKQRSESGVRGTGGPSLRAVDQPEEVRAMRRNGGGG